MPNHRFLPGQKHKVYRVAVSLLVGGLLAYLLLLQPGTAVLPRYLTLTWTGDPKTTQAITWQAGGLLTGGQQVEYWEQTADGVLSGPAQVARAERETLSTNRGQLAVYSAGLTGLKPGTRYIYRVGNGFIQSRPHSFVTAAADDERFKFLLFGDSQGSKYDDWQATLTKARQAQPDAAFMIHAGDLVDVGLDYGQWQDWFRAGEGIIDSVPVMPVMGNHETYTPDWQVARPEYYAGLFKLPANGPQALTGKVYSFDYGQVHFSVLDSQEQEEREFIPAIIKLQQTWLEQDLRATDKMWKLVFIHRPLYHNRPSPGDEDLQAAFAPIIDQYHVDAVFAGHDHVYARSYPIRNGVFNSGSRPGDGTVYFTTGRSGSRTFARAVAKDWDAVYYNPLDQPNYLTVEVAPASLTVRVFKQNGDSIDVWSINKQLPPAGENKQ